ncbi:MAG: 30S ribosomal protein S6 [Candidatus Paceibacterota bacterium]
MIEGEVMENEENIQDKKLVYEFAFHILPTVSEDDLGTKATEIRNLIEEKGGDVLFEDAPKHRELTYTMVKDIAGKKQRFSTAYFGWFVFELPRGVVTQIKEACDENPSILRFLIAKTTKEDALPKLASSAPIKRMVADEKKGEKVSEEELDKSINELVA